MARRPARSARPKAQQRLHNLLDRSGLYSVPLHEVEGWYEELYEDPFEIVDPDEFRLSRQRAFQRELQECLRRAHGK